MGGARRRRRRQDDGGTRRVSRGVSDGGGPTSVAPFEQLLVTKEAGPFLPSTWTHMYLRSARCIVRRGQRMSASVWRRWWTCLRQYPHQHHPVASEDVCDSITAVVVRESARPDATLVSNARRGLRAILRTPLSEGVTSSVPTRT